MKTCYIYTKEKAEEPRKLLLLCSPHTPGPPFARTQPASRNPTAAFPAAREERQGETKNALDCSVIGGKTDSCIGPLHCLLHGCPEYGPRLSLLGGSSCWPCLP